MKQNIMTAFAATLVAVVFVGVATAQQARPVLGGYRDISVDNANVKKAADAAVSAEAKRSEKEIELLEIVKAEQQNVRTTNYRMCLKVNTEGGEGQDAAEVFVKAIVNIDLKGVAKLISWEASDCGEGEGAAAVGSSPEAKFKPIAKTDPGAGLAADFAVKKHSEKTKSAWTLAEIVKAEDQEPGLMSRNFRLCMKGTTSGKSATAQAVVSMDQYSNLKLVSWADKC